MLKRNALQLAVLVLAFLGVALVVGLPSCAGRRPPADTTAPAPPQGFHVCFVDELGRDVCVTGTVTITIDGQE